MEQQQDWLIALPVWGDDYHTLFEQHVWPSIKTSLEGASGHVRYCFHTDRPDDIRALIGPDADAQFLWPPGGEVWMSYSQSHREASEFARKGEAIAFLNADILVSQEAFAAAERRFAEGKRAVVAAATRTVPVGMIMGYPPRDARGLLEWSLLFAHNMARECFWPTGQTTVPTTLYFTDGENVVLRGFFLHPFAVVKNGAMTFRGTVDQDALADMPIDDIHVVTDPDEMALAEVSLKMGRRLPSLPNHQHITQDSVLSWAASCTEPHHRDYFKHRIVLRGNAATTCDAPADAIDLRLKTIPIEREFAKRWYVGAERHAEGYMGKAVAAWAEAMEWQIEQADKAGLPRNPRYLADDWTGNIGHPTYLDLFVKAIKLGMVETDYVVLADMENVSTPTYLDCWREHIPFHRKTGYPHYWQLRREPTAIVKLNGEWRWFVDAHCEVEKRWVENGGKPLIKLPSADVRRGWAKTGLERGQDWFVALHVRDGNDGQAGRDGNRESYGKAIALIEQAGGHAIWVPSGERAHDIFLMSQARFMICNNAGPSLVAGTFGVPIVGADWHPIGIGYPYAGAMLLPKRMRLDGRLLSIEEQSREPFNHVQNPEVMAGLGIELVPNTEDEIAACVATMLGRLK